MNLRPQYSQYMNEQNVEGSGRASSYVRALDLLGPILAKSESLFPDCSNVWEIESVERIAELYQYILEQQRLGEDGIFRGETPMSYWRDRYCSAALKSYKEFLVLHPYKQKLWSIFNNQNLDPADLSKRLEDENLHFIEELVEDRDIDFSTREGKEKLYLKKTRVNQDFFRDMLLDTYDTQCCVTGLNFPDVLRASHIVGWAEDKNNRMNPENGLCLSATYDAAFDRHLISFDEDYRMIFSSQLKEYYSNAAFKTQFIAFEGKPLSRPKRYCPDQEFLQKHRDKMPV